MLSTRASRVALPTVLGALLFAAPGASAAAQRYAGPGGSDAAACTSADPCSLTKAVSGAVSGDEVIVAPGDYTVTASLSGTGLTIHGVAGRPRPRLLSNGAWNVLDLNESTLRYVEIENAPGQYGKPLAVHNSVVDQVIARGSAQPDMDTVWSRNTMIRNSIIVAPGPNGTAIDTFQQGGIVSGTYRNVTAIAPEAGGVAIAAISGGQSAAANVLARNVIARGGAGGASFVAEANNNGATAKIIVDHSNWLGGYTSGSASIVDAGGNQTATPAFVSAAAGDYREAAGSPTIDAGLSEIIDGDFDVEGDRREIFTIDIGADEFVRAPTATTGAATAVTDHSARLSGTVAANGAHAGYRFEYGPTATYGRTTAEADGGEGDAIAVAATIGALRPATTYHYRLVATNAGGASDGADHTFTTRAALPKPSPGPSPAPIFAGVKLMSKRLTFGGKVVALGLRCPAGTIGRCTGRTQLTAKRSHSRTTVRLGTARFSIAAGTRAKAKIRVSRAGRRLLAHARRLQGRDVSAARDGAGRSKTTVARVTIRRRHR